MKATDDYKVYIINEYWTKQVGKKASCPKCKIGKLIKFCSIFKIKRNI